MGEGVFDEFEEQGWDDASKLALALEYIERQQNDGAWRDFLQQQADEENGS